MNLDHIIVANSIKANKKSKPENLPNIYFPKQKNTILKKILNIILIIIAWLIFFGFQPAPVTAYITERLSFIFIILFLANFCIYNGYSYKYILDPNKRQLIKRIKFFAEEKDVVIAGFNKIKAIGVSKVFVKKEYKNKDLINRLLPNIQNEQDVYRYEILVVYDQNNKSAILEYNSSMDKMNDKANAASIITGCKFIKSDNNSKLLPNPDGGNAMPMIWSSHEIEAKKAFFRTLCYSTVGFVIFIILSILYYYR